MYETTVTIVGNVIDSPHHRRLDTGISVTSFRVASTARRYDRSAQLWADGDSLFAKVTCWRQLAENVVRCVLKGDPIVVTGRLYTRIYEVDGQRRASYEIDALSIGFDLAKGQAKFTRNRDLAMRPDATTDVPDEETSPAPVATTLESSFSADSEQRDDAAVAA